MQDQSALTQAWAWIELGDMKAINKSSNKAFAICKRLKSTVHVCFCYSDFYYTFKKKDTCSQSMRTPYPIPNIYTNFYLNHVVDCHCACVSFCMKCVHVSGCYGHLYPMPKLQTTGYYQSHIYAWNGITKEAIVHSSNEIVNLWSTWIDMQIFWCTYKHRSHHAHIQHSSHPTTTNSLVYKFNYAWFGIERSWNCEFYINDWEFHNIRTSTTMINIANKTQSISVFHRKSKLFPVRVFISRLLISYYLF